MTKRKSKHSEASSAKRFKTEQESSHDYNEMSDYEKAIQENIRRNNDVLLQLNMLQARQDLIVSNSTKKTSKLKMKTTATEPKVRRHSLRIRKLEPDGVTTVPDCPPVLNTSSSSLWDKPRQKGQLNMTLASEGKDEDSKCLLSVLGDLMSKTKQGESTLALTSDHVSYKKEMENLEVKEHHVTKVCPNRIYSILVHGMKTKTLVFVGDTKGHLGLWDANSREENNVLVYQPHFRCVAAMAISPYDPSQLFTCSYDGSIRCAYFEQAVFDEVCNVDEDDTYYTYMAYGSTSSHTLLASSGDGQVHIVDYRQNCNTNALHYQLYDRAAIKCLDVHPENKNIFVTSTNKGTISLWDIRKLKGPRSSTCQLHPHSRSVSSVFFSPKTGEQLLSTSIDNSIVIHDVTSNGEKKEKSCVFRHDNHTGRWLSTFHAKWDPKTDSCFAVGSMMRNPRQIDIYSSYYKSGALFHLRHDNFTTITSRLAFHPSMNMIAGGNSSGKVFLWSAS